MEERIQLFWQYFPIYMHEEGTYFQHHHTHLIKCVESGLYASAYPHLHILYMLFVYTQLLRIAHKDESALRLFSAGFSIYTLPGSMDNPHIFSKINEKSVFHLFRVAGFNDAEINNFSSVVNERNKIFHASDESRIDGKDEFQRQVNDYRSKMRNIVKKQIKTLNRAYSDTISSNPVYRRKSFRIDIEEIEINFSNRENFFSPYELMLVAGNRKDAVSSFIREEYSNIDI